MEPTSGRRQCFLRHTHTQQYVTENPKGSKTRAKEGKKKGGKKESYRTDCLTRDKTKPFIHQASSAASHMTVLVGSNSQSLNPQAPIPSMPFIFKRITPTHFFSSHPKELRLPGCGSVTVRCMYPPSQPYFLYACTAPAASWFVLVCMEAK